MAVEDSIFAGLNGKLAALIFSPAIPVAWPNVSFTPPTATPSAKWIRPTLLPAQTFAQSLNANGSNRHDGIYQVDVFYGLGGGETDARAIAAQIIAHFKFGTRITKDGFKIDVIDTPWLLPIVKDDPWIMLAVRIPYSCFASNPA